MIPQFTELILQFIPPEYIGELTKKKQINIRLVLEMRNAFSLMTVSDLKYANPEDILKNIIDDYGNKVLFGEQKDAGEFNLNFISKVDDGISTDESISHVGPLYDQVTDLLKSYSLYIQPEKVSSRRILKLFFGKFDAIISYAYDNKTQSTEMKDNVFGQITLNPAEGNLYSAWIKNYFTQSIENFKTNIGENVNAQQSFWITALPTVFFFQIQRVTYDKASKCLSKINTPFEIKKEIYADAFLKKNMSDSKKAVQRFFDLESQIKEYDAYIHRWDQVESVNGKLFGGTIEFMKSQKNDKIIGIDDKTATSLFIPEELSLYSNQTHMIKTIATFFEKSSTIAFEKLKLMKDKKEKIQKELESVFEKKDKHPYLLHSILVHSGSAVVGHYYAFVNDYENKQWWRFNDTSVTQETEDVVMSESIGGNGYSSAYYLVYIDKNECLKSFNKGRTHNFSISNNSQKSLYYSWTPSHLKENIEAFNKKMALDAEDDRLDQMLVLIDNSYSVKYDMIVEYKKSRQFEHSYKVINFIFYLSSKLENLSKWYLLNEVFVECYGKSLDKLTSTDRVKLKLSEIIRDNTMYPKSLNMDNIVDIPKYQTEYKNLSQAYLISNYAFWFIYNDHWDNAIEIYLAHIKKPNTEIIDRLKVFIECILMATYDKLKANYLCSPPNYTTMLAMFNTLFKSITCLQHTLNIKILAYLKANINGLLLPKKSDIDKACPSIYKDLKVIDTPGNSIKIQSEMPSDLTDSINTINECKTLYKWNEGWKEDQLAIQYERNLSSCSTYLEV